VLADVAAEGACTADALEQAEDVANHRVKGSAALDFGRDVVGEAQADVHAAGHRGVVAEEALIDLGEHVGILVGGAPEHDAIDVIEVSGGILQGLDAAVDEDLELGALALDTVDERIVQRRDVAILFGGQPFEPGLAGVDDEGLTTGGGDGIDERGERLLQVLVVDAQAALHRDGNGDGCAHGADALGDELGLRHQARAEAPRLHSIRRASAVEVDLVVAEAFGNAGGLGQLRGARAAELDGDGMFLGGEAEQSLTIPMEDGTAGHHLRIEEGAPAQKAQEESLVAIRPVHHRGDGETAGQHGSGPGSNPNGLSLPKLFSALERPRRPIDGPMGT